MDGNAFSVLFEMGPDDGGASDSEKQIAIANLERFRGATDPDVALEAFLALCRYADSQEPPEGG